MLDVAQIAKAITGYLLSPGLSVFLFAPPLIFVLGVGRKAYRRWPLETTTLSLAAVAHLLMIASNKTWSGDLSYGPRYMVESIVLLMPRTLPAFEMAVKRAPRRAALAVATVMFLGFMVQIVGVSVSVSANEVKRIASGIVANNAWVFVPGASPIVYDLEDLAARRNLSPWAFRALAFRPGATAVDCPGCDRGVRWMADIPRLQGAARRACTAELARTSDRNRVCRGDPDCDWICASAAAQPGARRPRFLS